jgi:hypothetical protein
MTTRRLVKQSLQKKEMASSAVRAMLTTGTDRVNAMRGPDSPRIEMVVY